MIFKKGDILQFCLEGDAISKSFVFFQATRDTKDQNETVRGYLPNGELALTRDAHRYNLVSGSIPTTVMQVEGDEYLDMWYKNRPYSKYISVLP
jgi:hypothetical protein